MYTRTRARQPQNKELGERMAEEHSSSSEVDSEAGLKEKVSYGFLVVSLGFY